MRVLGVNAARKGWLVVELIEGQFTQAYLAKTLLEIVERLPGAVTIGVDIPIGLPREGCRQADLEAKRFVGDRRSSVFLSPVRAVLACETHKAANALAIQLTRAGLSAQAYALRNKIFEAEKVVGRHSHIIEVHPEVTFRHLAGAPLRTSKKSWDGFWTRHELLRAAGVEIPVELGSAGAGSSDDVLDAAAAPPGTLVAKPLASQSIRKRTRAGAPLRSGTRWRLGAANATRAVPAEIAPNRRKPPIPAFRNAARNRSLRGLSASSQRSPFAPAVGR
jgi:predicted RNase H-like nuclease